MFNNPRTALRWRQAAALSVTVGVVAACGGGPSDVVGGYLLAGLWMALAVAGLRAAERRWPTSFTAPRAKYEARFSKTEPSFGGHRERASASPTCCVREDRSRLGD